MRIPGSDSRWKCVSRALTALCLLSVSAIAAATGEVDKNLIDNGSFEKVVDGLPVCWSLEGEPSVIQSLSSDDGVTSGRCARLDCTKFKRMTRHGYAMMVHEGPISLESAKWYRFSCWARQEGMDGAMVTVELQRELQVAHPYLVTEMFLQMPVRYQWKRFEKHFRVDFQKGRGSRLAFYFDFPGKLWVDDVEIVEVPKPMLEFTNQIPVIGSTNLLPNASFEVGADHWSTLSKRNHWSPGLSGLFGTIQNRDAWHGEQSIRIELGPGKTAETTYANWHATHSLEHTPLVANIGWVNVDVGKNYTLSAYMRADKAGIPAMLLLRFSEPIAFMYGSRREDIVAVSPSKAVTLSTDWQRYAFTVPAKERYVFAAVGPDMRNCSQESATVWIDAIQLEEGSGANVFGPREPIEVGLNTNKFGNVFHSDETLEVMVQASNATEVPGHVRLSIQVRDYFDRNVYTSSERLYIPAGGRTSLKILPGLTDTGFFRAHATWDADGRKHTRSMRLAVIEPYPYVDSVFGINNAPCNNESCRLLRNAGLIWTRNHAMSWQNLEPEPGQFSFDMMDRHVDRVLSTGMQMIGLLPPHPSSDWTSAAPEGAEDSFIGIPKEVWATQAYAPKDLDAFAHFVTTAVDHWKERISVWEYLNEPFYTLFALPAMDQIDANVPNMPGAHYSVEDYVRLLKVHDSAVKTSDPGATTIGGIGGRPDLLTKEFFEAHGLDCVDTFNLHIYPGLRKPEAYISQMENMLDDMDACASSRKPIWITEYAYYGAETLPWQPYIVNICSWGTDRLLRDERQCADYSVRFAAIMLAHGVEKLLYYHGGSGGGHVNDEVNLLNDPFLVHAGMPRKLYAAQAALANVLGPRPAFVCPMEKPPYVQGHSTELVCGYAFQCRENAALIAWAPERETEAVEWCLRLPERSKALNVVGAAIPGRRIVMGESPVYITSSSIRPQELAKTCILHVRQE